MFIYTIKNNWSVFCIERLIKKAKAVLENQDTPEERKKEILLAGMPWNYNKLN